MPFTQSPTRLGYVVDFILSPGWGIGDGGR